MTGVTIGNGIKIDSCSENPMMIRMRKKGLKQLSGTIIGNQPAGNSEEINDRVPGIVILACLINPSIKMVFRFIPKLFIESGSYARSLSAEVVGICIMTQPLGQAGNTQKRFMCSTVQIAILMTNAQIVVIT